MGGVFLLGMLGLALELAGSGGGRAAREDEQVERTAAQPTSTSRLRPARTPRQTAKSTTESLTGCAIDNVPEPLSNHLDCETWEVA